MHTLNNGTARLYGTAKIHKFEHPRDINEESIKF